MRLVKVSTLFFWLSLGNTYESMTPETIGDNIHIQGTLEAT